MVKLFKILVCGLVLFAVFFMGMVFMAMDNMCDNCDAEVGRSF